MKLYQKIFIYTISFLFIIYYINLKKRQLCLKHAQLQKELINSIPKAPEKIFTFNHKSPLVLITGFPGSGMSLLKNIFNANQNVHCGDDTMLIMRMLQHRNELSKSVNEIKRLQEAKITSDILDSATSSFIIQLFLKKSLKSDLLCNVDSGAAVHGPLLKKLFPNSKFIFMIRDGRAVLGSYMINGFFRNYFQVYQGDTTQVYEQWLESVKSMFHFCNSVGKQSCLLVCKLISYLFIY